MSGLWQLVEDAAQLRQEEPSFNAAKVRQPFSSLEVCAGAGGQALGLEQAGFSHAELVEIDPAACATLRANRPKWNVHEGDLREYVEARRGLRHKGIDLLAGGVPCPPFSVAGKQLGCDDERNLFGDLLQLALQAEPRAILVENVRGLMDEKFASYRRQIIGFLKKAGYRADWQLVKASDFGVPQLRPRSVLIALKGDLWPYFAWPAPSLEPAPTVGEVLYQQMASRGWRGAEEWRNKASDIAPTLVGGSKKHGGADLGPSRAKKRWAELGVDGLGVADAPPGPDFQGMPRLTVQMAARIQGFPEDWKIMGKKTAAYRQVGNAFPPPVSCALGSAIRECFLEAAASEPA